MLSTLYKLLLVFVFVCVLFRFTFIELAFSGCYNVALEIMATLSALNLVCYAWLYAGPAWQSCFCGFYCMGLQCCPARDILGLMWPSLQLAVSSPSAQTYGWISVRFLEFISGLCWRFRLIACQREWNFDATIMSHLLHIIIIYYYIN